MLNSLLLWARRNSRRALALALAPGLVALALDAAIGHWAGKDFDNRLQTIPVAYGLLGFLAVVVASVPRSRALFAGVARAVGALGVLIGLVGTGLHLQSLLEEMEGQYTAASLEGALSVGPPVLAPLAFSALGLVLFFLPSAKLLLRLRLGTVAPAAASVTHLEPVRADTDDSARRESA